MTAHPTNRPTSRAPGFPPARKATVAEDMAAFDTLPPAMREFLRVTDLRWSAVSAAEMLAAGAVDMEALRAKVAVRTRQQREHDYPGLEPRP